MGAGEDCEMEGGRMRGRFQGVGAIVRFNWPFYLVAALAVFVLTISCFLVPVGWSLAVLLCGLSGGVYFLSVSLLVSYWIYDLSDLYRFRWLARISGIRKAKRVVFCHCGFDEASELLKSEIGNAELVVLDHYDPERMTEASIKRARKLFPPTGETIAVAYDQWPTERDRADLVFGILAIHEFRSVGERAAWFAEAKRSLAAGGKIIVIEHVRDAANFLAFGPGFLHFHSVGKWRESWESAGLKLANTFRITPWVRVFAIKANE